jgi:DNA-binding IclR family transcriptional regulator
MSYTFEELRHTRVVDLREIAKDIEHDALRGYSTMHKEELVNALCTALGIEAHVHHEVVGIDKTRVKARIRDLKAQRDAALQAKDRVQLKRLRRKIHRLKRRIHKATV